MTKIFADGPTLGQLESLLPKIQGVTYNPSLMKKLGVKDYKEFAKEAMAICPDKPISFEVLSDDPIKIEREATEIASWGKNAVVKLPVVDTAGRSLMDVAMRCSTRDISLNVTAVMTELQAVKAAKCLIGPAPAYISIFAGRISDTGRDPAPMMERLAGWLTYHYSHIQLIWASPREVLNYYQAEQAGVHIITLVPDLIKKLALRDKDLVEYSVETVKMFSEDAKAAGLTI